MNKLTRKALLSLALAAGIANPAFAAELSNAIGSYCYGNGTWHFVNNQTGDAAQGTLTATFSTGNVMASAYKVLNSTQHFSVSTFGKATLVGASTNLDGRLVLSDFTCIPKY